MVKKQSIILRIDEETHNTIKIKANLFGKKKSDYIRHSSLSFWDKSTDNIKFFKKLLKDYQEGSEEDKKLIVNLLFEYYRRNGYPHNELTDEQKIEEMDKVINSNKILLEEDHLQQNLIGIGLANYFHPHMVEARYKGRDKSPYETYSNDDNLKDCINRWMELGKTPNPAGIRRILKTRDGSRGVVNFKSVISKFIYQNYTPENGKVLDPCSGYSGRLVGCIAANKNLLYHGIDPDKRTMVGNTKCASFFNNRYDPIFSNKIYNYRFRFDLGCAEDIMPEIREEYDLVFTSPPYHNTEIYSEEKDQSCNKYQEYQEWLDKFLFVICRESKRILKSGGYLIINLKNYKKNPIADDFVNYCKDLGFLLEKTYQMRMGNSEYHRIEGKKMYHTEPIFVFKK